MGPGAGEVLQTDLPNVMWPSGGTNYWQAGMQKECSICGKWHYT